MAEPRRFVFTLTAGRTGTAGLAKLFEVNFPAAECHLEIIGWDSFGLDSPDLSTMTLFNSQGNVAPVRAFWERKFERILASPAAVYVETSHVLMKAGLMENLDLIEGQGDVHFVILQRDLFETVMSYRNRYDFTNKSMWWLWYLDPRYPRNIVDSSRLAGLGINGVCLWYIFEVRARAAYYRMLFEGRGALHFHRIDLAELNDTAKVSELLQAVTGQHPAAAASIPARQNRGKNRHPFPPGEIDAIRQLIDKVDFDAEATARGFIEQGRRL
jgi:hypothetical protein